MDIQPVLAAIAAMSPDERQVVRAHLEVLEGGRVEEPATQQADSEQVRRTARELMHRFPDSMRKLANP